MTNKTKKKIIVGMSTAAMLATLGVAGAYFTDFDTKSVSTVAGSLDIEVADNSALDADADGIINPGDTGKLSFTVSNKGSKSADLMVVAKLTSDVAMTDGAYEYTLSDLGTPAVSDDKKVLTYTANLGTVNGSIETENGVNSTNLSKEVNFTFDRAAKNVFQNSNANIEYTVYAKQHRNTEDTDWDTIGSFEQVIKEATGGGDDNKDPEQGGNTETPTVKNGIVFNDESGVNQLFVDDVMQVSSNSDYATFYDSISNQTLLINQEGTIIETAGVYEDKQANSTYAVSGTLNTDYSARLLKGLENIDGKYYYYIGTKVKATDSDYVLCGNNITDNLPSILDDIWSMNGAYLVDKEGNVMTEAGTYVDTISCKSYVIQGKINDPYSYTIKYTTGLIADHGTYFFFKTDGTMVKNTGKAEYLKYLYNGNSYLIDKNGIVQKSGIYKDDSARKVHQVVLNPDAISRVSSITGNEIQAQDNQNLLVVVDGYLYDGLGSKMIQGYSESYNKTYQQVVGEYLVSYNGKTAAVISIESINP